MAIELEHSFAVPVPPEQAWDVLLDVARVAPCMPGATVDEVDGDVVTGKIKVKVGPIALTYTGKATFTERDDEAHTVKIAASGKETRGAGTASATVHAALVEEDGQTRVTVQTSLNVTGRPAQFGRGVMAEVGGRLVEKFSANLAEQLATQGTADPAPAESPAVDGRLSIPIQELSLPARSSSILKDAGIDTVGALVSRTQSDLLAIKNIGEKSVEEIQEKLQDLGLTLAGGTAAANGAPETSLDGDDLQATGQGVDGGPRPAAGLPREEADEEEEALDLLDVAAGPVLKRALPAAGVAAVLLWLGFRLRRRVRRAGS